MHVGVAKGRPVVRHLHVDIRLARTALHAATLSFVDPFTTVDLCCHNRQDGSNIGNGSVSNAQPYSHVSYDYQDVRMLYPQYNATLAHYARMYDTYTGNSSYLQMQLWQNFKRTAGQNKVGLSLTVAPDCIARCIIPGCAETAASDLLPDVRGHHMAPGVAAN